MRAICQLCGEFYAEVNLDGTNGIKPLSYPMTGAMFGSPDPFHGVPVPFDPSAEWQFMMCPYGRTHRPIVEEDLVKTHKGMVRLPRDGSPAFLDTTATGDIDRGSIGDRVVQVSDEEAEKRARAAIDTEKKESAEEKILPNTPEPGYEMFICQECGKKFSSERQLKGHMGGAHRAKPKPNSRKLLAKAKK